jgi:hypothetical protein
MVLVLLFATACGDKVQIAEPPSADSASVGPPPKVGTEDVGTHRTMRSPFDEAEINDTSTGSNIGEEVVFFRGVVSVDPSIELPPTYALFLSAGFPPKGRPPVLSKRIADAPALPFHFELTSKDIAFGSTEVDTERPLVLYVTISESGKVSMGGSNPPGLYLNSPVSEPIKPGAMDVVLNLREAR